MGASPCAKAGPDPQVDEQLLLSSAALAWYEIELSGVPRNRMLELTPWQESCSKELGNAGRLLAGGNLLCCDII